MTEGDDDNHKILLLPILICLMSAIGGSIAVNAQFDGLKQNSELGLNEHNTSFFKYDVTTSNNNKSLIGIVNDLKQFSDSVYYQNPQLSGSQPAGNGIKENGTAINIVNASSTVIWDLNGTKTVYLTSDDIISKETDRKFLNRIASNLRSNGIQVIIDPYAPNPDQVPRSIKNAPEGSAVVIVNYNCAGTIKDLGNGISGPQTNGKSDKGYLYEHAKDLTGIIYVNVSPETILMDSSYLPRAHDDEFSTGSFSGINNPSEYLLDNGISLIDSPQPVYPVMGIKRADVVSNRILELLKQ